MISSEIYSSRVQALERVLGKRGIQGTFLLPGPNKRYFMGFHTKAWERLTLAFLPARSSVVPSLDFEKAKSYSM
ncbi:MAG: hypothetical protein ACE5KH_02715 [Candidatus Geothermarchaeales archaeon]